MKGDESQVFAQIEKNDNFTHYLSAIKLIVSMILR